MNLEQKHMFEKNTLARNSGALLAVAVFIFSAMACLEGVTVLLVVRLFSSAVSTLLVLGLYPKLKTQHVYKYVVTLSMAILFLMTIFHATSPQIFAIMYSIIIVVLIYGEQQTVTIGCIVALVGLTASDAIDIYKNDLSFNDAFTQIIFAAIACYLAIFFCRQRRQQDTEKMDAVAAGAEVQTKISNEIIELAENLNQKFVDAQDVSDKLNESMEATHSSVMEIVEGTKNTAEAIEHQTQQTADISQNIALVGEEASNIGEVSARVETTVSEGVALIEKLKFQAEEVAKINIETSGTTQALNDSIQDVQAITETILGISSQTNLLALNASIEAARAGEAGKGFAVVADEIRALSESTREATEEIARIIERLTADAKSAADAMDRSAEYANKQHELITETGAKLMDIKSETDELHEGVVQVKDSVATVIDANTQIMDSITNLSATSQQVAASTDTVLSVSDAAMDALENMNGTLDEIKGIATHMESVAEGNVD